MSTHTPGPWVADDSNVLVGRHVLAIVNDPDQPSHLTEVSKANANLIAAAPELLEAARTLRDELRLLTEGEKCDHSVGICWCATFRALEAGDAILARAEGHP